MYDLNINKISKVLNSLVKSQIFNQLGTDVQDWSKTNEIKLE